MKKLFLLLFIPFVSFGQIDEERYKLYPTENVYTFLKLDTATGRVWQIQYGVGDVEGNTVVLSDFDYSLGNGQNGKYKLYPTQNMWNFLMLDTDEGITYQVQWHTDEDKRMILWIPRHYSEYSDN